MGDDGSFYGNPGPLTVMEIRTDTIDRLRFTHPHRTWRRVRDAVLLYLAKEGFPDTDDRDSCLMFANRMGRIAGRSVKQEIVASAYRASEEVRLMRQRALRTKEAKDG